MADVDTTLLELMQELVEGYDSTIDTTSGAAFRTKVLDPFLTRIGDSPLDVDLENFLVTRLQTEIDDIDVSSHSALRDLIVRPMVVMLAPFRRELSAIKNSQSLNNYETMTRTEVNALLGNFFLSIQDGEKAIGEVRLYFRSPVAVVLTSSTEFTTSSGLIFFPSTLTSISATSMAFNVESGLYYMDVTVEAEENGEDYNIAEGLINSMSVEVGAVSITNKLALTSAADDETKAEAVIRAEESITVRNLSTKKGIQTLISENFPAIDTMTVIGFGDTEMVRDIVYGPNTVSGVPGGFEGSGTLDLLSGVGIHIGGKTDVYLYQPERVEETIDITNITDVGERVMAGISGYTSPTGTGSFYDNHGYFSTQGVAAGDYLRLGTPPLAGADEPLSWLITAATDESTLAIDVSSSAPDLGLFEQTYEIVRYTNADRFITVPLYDLLAVESDGTAAATDGGDPVYPIPGDPDLLPLSDEDGDYVEKEENVASNNMKLPTLRINSIEILSEIDGTGTTEHIPLREVLRVEALDDFVDSGPGQEGTVRVYFKDPTNITIVPGIEMGTVLDSDVTEFTFGTMTFVPPPLASVEEASTVPSSGDYTPGGDDNLLGNLLYFDAASAASPYDDETDFLEQVYPGLWIGIVDIDGSSDTADGCGLYMIEEVAYDSVEDACLVYLRADLFTGDKLFEAGAEIDCRLLPGCRFEPVDSDAYEADDSTESVIQSDDDKAGIYYFDLKVQSTEDWGAVGILSEGDELTVEGLYAEGYVHRSDSEGYAFSNREKPHIEITNYFNESNLRKTSTAYSLRITYEHCSTIESIQDFVDDDDNRIVAEDILIKHLLPSLVSADISTLGIGETTALELIEEFINSISPTSDLEVSDLISELYANGGTHVTLPITLVVYKYGQDRSVSVDFISDVDTANRIQKYLMDSALTYTEES